MGEAWAGWALTVLAVVAAGLLWGTWVELRLRRRQAEALDFIAEEMAELEDGLDAVSVEVGRVAATHADVERALRDLNNTLAEIGQGMEAHPLAAQPQRNGEQADGRT